MRRFITGLLLCLFFISSAWGAEVTVQRFSPQGETQLARPKITVTFSAPVVKKAQLNKPLKGNAVPIKFRPAIAGTAKWVKENELVFTPQSDILAATRYDADFGPGGLRTASGQLIAGPQSFSFNRPALSFDSVTQLSFASQSREAVIRLDFSTEVSPVRLRGFLSLFDANGSSVGYSIRGQSPSKQVIIDTNRINGGTLKIVVAGVLLPNQGDLPQDGGREATISLTSETLVTGSSANMNAYGRGSINVDMNCQVDLEKVKGYIELSPAVPFTLSSSYYGFNIQGDFAPRSRVSLTIKKGMAGRDSSPLSEDFVKSFIFPDLPSSVRFPSAGLFLTPAEAPRVAIETSNVQTLELTAWKLYNNNVPVATLNLDDWSSDFTRWAKPLGSKKYRVGGAVNEVTRRAVDLKALVGEGEGVYLLRARNADPDTWDDAQMLLCITDTAVSARVYKRGLQVWTASISDSKGLAGADVKVFSSSNQLLLTGTTDAEGCVSFSQPDGWGADLEPAMVMVEKEGRISFVKLGTNQLSGRDVDISGAPWNDAYEGLWIMPRALWQPGERLEAEAIVRSTALDLPGEFPLRWTLTGRGIELASGVMKLNAQGVGSIATEIPATVESGNYSLRLTVPGTRTVVAERTVQIEEFKPPQIETSVKAPKLMRPGQEAQFEIGAKYLFGGSGAGLKWEMSYSTVPEAYKSKAFPGYVFGSEMAKDAGRSSGSIDEGVLDGDGAATVTWTPEPDLKAPSIIRAHVRLSVMEANGRWTGRTVAVPIYPTEALIGVMKPQDSVRPNVETSVGLVALNPQDKKVNLGDVNVIVSLVQSRYVMVNDGSGSRMTWQEEISEQSRQKIKLNGTAQYAFKPKDEGEYLLTFENEKGRASVRISVWEPWNGSAALNAAMPDRVEMKADRDSYKPGEKAKIFIKSPFTGRAILTHGSDRPISVAAFDMKEKEMTVEIDVTEDMLPNSWCSIQVTRPEGADTKPPYRALGALPLKLDLTERRLKVTVETPEKAEPGELKAKILVTDAAGLPVDGLVSVALVDRGILLLAGSDNANPWEFFTRRRAMDGKLCDIYDSLLPIEARGTALLHPAGGDDAEMSRMKLMANADMMSPVRAMDYKPLAIWLPSVKVTGGTAEISAEVPEFAGALRVEAIAVDGASLGRSSGETKIARPVVIDSSLPRFAAPGDEFSAVLNVTPSMGGAGSAQVLPSEGLTFAQGKSWKDEKISFTADKRLDLSPSLPTLNVLSGSAKGTLDAKVTLGGRTYEKQVSMAIRPPYPLSSLLGGDSAAEGTTEFTVPGDWYPGTAQVKISLAGAPVVDALSLLNCVDNWGCWLDRLISRGWITLNLPSLLSEKDQDLSNPQENRIAMNTVLASLTSLQLYDGSWSAWRSGATDPWGSVAALHLLTAVKDEGVIEPSGLSTGYQWLRRYMAEPLPEKDVTEALNARAYGCYVLALAEQAPLGWMNWLEERASDLDNAGRALLAASYALAGETEKAKALAGTEAAGSGEALNLRDAGFRMLALDAIEPGGSASRDLAGRIAEELAKGRGKNNARDAGSMIMALGVFSKHVAGGSVQAKLLSDDGAELAVYDGKPVVWSGGAGGGFKLVTTGTGSLWYSWSASGVPNAAPKPYTRGVRVVRTFLDAKTKEPVDPASIVFGQELIMKIKLASTSKGRDLRVSVLLPAGLEASEAGEMVQQERSYSARGDLRFDRLLLNLSGDGKSMEWNLPCRAIVKGSFVLPPISVEALGNKGVGFLGKAETLNVN